MDLYHLGTARIMARYMIFGPVQPVRWMAEAEADQSFQKKFEMLSNCANRFDFSSSYGGSLRSSHTDSCGRRWRVCSV